jgi:hypothetical protein
VELFEAPMKKKENESWVFQFPFIFMDSARWRWREGKLALGPNIQADWRICSEVFFKWQLRRGY